MQLLRLPRTEIRLGETLPWNIRDKQARVLLSRGDIIKSQDQLDALLAGGAFVDAGEAREVQRAKGLRLAEQAEQADQAAMSASKSLFDLWAQSTDEMRKVMRKAPDAPNLPGRVADLAAWLVELTDRDEDIALYRTVRQESQHLFYFGYNHSIHTAVLCLLMSRRMQWPVDRTMSLVKAALTMNMAILDLQGKLAEQEDGLLPSQRAMIQSHPKLAAEWLVRAGVTDNEWLGAVSEHHERSDGSGYPMGKETVDTLAVALRVADVFLAKISRRKVRVALTIQEAARQLFREDQGGPLSTSVIKEFGIFPPGDVVKLANGETAVVIRRTDNAKSPIVAAITDAKGQPTVRTTRRDTSNKAYAIVATIADPGLVSRMPAERLYGFPAAR